MHIIHIVCGNNRPTTLNADDTIFWWDKANCAKNEYSIPKYCKENLQYLRQEFIEFIHNLGQSVVRGKPLYKWFYAHDRLSMWWCSLLFEKHPQLMPELYEVLKLLSLEQMLNNFKQKNIQIVLHNANNQLYQCLKQYCLLKKIEFARAKDKVSLQVFIQNASKLIVQKVKNNVLSQLSITALRFIHWLLFIKLKVKHNKQLRPSKSCVTVVSYYPTGQKAKVKDEVFESPYWLALQKNLAKAEKNINWLFIRINSTNTTLKQAVNNIKIFKKNKLNSASFHFAEEFLSIAEIWQALFRYMKICLTSQRLINNIKPHCMLGNMNIWVYLKPYYVKSFQSWLCLERCLQRRAMLGYVAWSGVQEWTLFPLENCPWERMLTEAIKYNNCGKVYGAQHSVVRAADFRYFDSPNLFNQLKNNIFLPDKILVNGEASYNTLLDGNVPENFLQKVEALRYVYLANFDQINTQDKVLNKTKTKQLIIVTSFFPQLMDEHIQLLGSWLKKTQSNSWQIIIKPHPYCCVKKSVKRHIPKGQHINITSKSIYELFIEAKNNTTKVWAANDTSVIIEALYANIPLMIQNEGNGFDFCPARGIDGLEYVYTCEDVQRALENNQVLPFEKQFFNLDSNLTQWKKLLNL